MRQAEPLRNRQKPGVLGWSANRPIDRSIDGQSSVGRRTPAPVRTVRYPIVACALAAACTGAPNAPFGTDVPGGSSAIVGTVRAEP